MTKIEKLEKETLAAELNENTSKCVFDSLQGLDPSSKYIGHWSSRNRKTQIAA